MKKEHMIIGAVAVFLVLATFSIGILMPHGENSAETTSIVYGSNVCVDKISNGVTTNIACHHNILVNQGKTYIQQALGQGISTNISQLALGNGTNPVAGDTALNQIYTTCGLGINNATYFSNGVGNWSQVFTWTSTCDNTVVNSTALYQQNGLLFAGTTFTPTTLMTNDQIKVNYTVTVS